MDFEKFLLSISTEAHECSQQFFLHDLSLEDRKNLRLVSRAINDVVLGYPIVTTLHISTHAADVNFLQLVSANLRLAKHVETLVWDHSVHELLLLHNSFFRQIITCFGLSLRHPESEQESTLREEAAMAVWERLAREQQFNIEFSIDEEVLCKLLPHLRNVHTVVFTSQEFGALNSIPSDNWSPAMREWRHILDFVKERIPSPCATGWYPEFGSYFSPMTARCCSHLTTIISQSAKREDRFWHRIPVRGIRFFMDVAIQCVAHRQVLQPSSNPPAARLQMLFPKLSTLKLSNIQQEFLSPREGGQELLFLRRSTAGLQHLQLAVPRIKPSDVGDEGQWSRAIDALVFPAAYTLRHLHIGDIIKAHESYTVSVIAAAKLVRKMPLLTSLDLSGGSTSLLDLRLLGSGIRTSRSMQHLSLHGTRLSRGRWREVLLQWKGTGDLNKLKTIRIEAVVGETEVAFGPNASGFVRSSGFSSSLILQWLRREQVQYPMYSELI